MAGFTLLAIGKMRGELAAVYADYAKRLTPPLQLIEAEAPKSTREQAQGQWENNWLQKQLPAKAFMIALDPLGKTYTSPQLAQQLGKWQQTGQPLFFVLGGATGLDTALKQRAQALLSFGPNTWPHVLCRVMLVEQIYRAQSIAAGHPYHRA